MATEPVGVTFIVPENQDAIGIYEAEGGVEVFETDEPYLLSDGKSLVDPMPVRMVDGPIYQDTLGNAQSALAITLVSSWSPADLFANGEQGSFWGPLPYYSDAAGTVEADWGDPVGFIPDASGNGNDWTQITSTARPILRDSPPRLEFDGTDDQVTTTLPAISGGTIVLAGTNGIWIDELDFAGGAFSVGPDTYTGGPAGLMSILGDILVGGGFVIDRALTPEEIAQVEGYYKARGSAGLIELGPEMVVNGDFSDGLSGWRNDNDWWVHQDSSGFHPLSDVFNTLRSSSISEAAGEVSLVKCSIVTDVGTMRVQFRDASNSPAGGGSSYPFPSDPGLSSGDYAALSLIPVGAESLGFARHIVGQPMEGSVNNVSIRRLIMPGDTP